MAIITLTSDFGTKDYLAGAFKGRLLQQIPSVNIVDITHDVAGFNFAEAAYIINNSVKHFPSNSYHLLLFNLFHTTQSHPLFAFHHGYYYGVPDNGLLPMVLGSNPERVIVMPLAIHEHYDTLAWADLYGKAIQQIEDGLAFDKLGKEPELLVEKTNLKANYGDNFIDGRIIFIDRFENVVVNITRKDFDEIGKGRKFSIMFKSRDTIQKISDGYPQVTEGSSLAFFNSAGYLEIAVNKGNAASLFGLQTFDHLSNPDFIKARMFYQTVHIRFE